MAGPRLLPPLRRTAAEARAFAVVNYGSAAQLLLPFLAIQAKGHHISIPAQENMRRGVQQRRQGGRDMYESAACRATCTFPVV